MPETEIVTCCTCGYEWMAGQDGTHSCSSKMAATIARLKVELEVERIRIAACSVIAMADTPESAAQARVMLPAYESAAAADVARRVDECMALRQENVELKAERNALGVRLAEIEVQGLAELSAQKLAVRAAVSAIYLADSSDYLGALWDVVRALHPNLAELLGRDERVAWLIVQDEPERAEPADGCGACGDACRSRRSCRLADESPQVEGKRK